MCGITACVGCEEAVSTLLSGLDNLEYRGYDSAGIAVPNGASLEVVKRSGEVAELARRVRRDRPGGTTGIGHTRWSTHGEPSDENAHPHTDCTGRVAVVHNGIVENYASLRDRLRASGHVLDSETDTEVVPHLVEEYLAAGATPVDALRATLGDIDGSYAIAMVVADSDRVYAARNGSPLVLGLGDDANYLASDVPAFIERTDSVVYLDDGDVVAIGPNHYEVTGADGRVRDRPVRTVEWTAEDAEKGRYDHYMHKEIHEQPRALEQTLQGRLGDGVALDDLADETLDGVERVAFVACGTSYHASLYGARLLIERGVPASAHLASEYVTAPPPARAGTIVVGVTQSGETADTLAALREAHSQDQPTLAVTNTVGSTAARECDDALFIRAGPEIGVAATKTFSSQVATLALLAEQLAAREGTGRGRPFRRALAALPDGVRTVVESDDVRSVARQFRDSDAYFFVGRGTGHPVALEGALKLKEITYEHAEGFAAGELKHGPLALVTERTPVFAIDTGHNTEKVASNAEEIRSRGGPVVAVGPADSPLGDRADAHLPVPDTDPALTGVLANVHLQLLAYHVAAELDRPIDKPRNLAKSVTVE
ncbi:MULTISPECIES: glutamine--fructose-6-phosphate transaminase (isomerizing) [Halomicrobium]|uniref:Glutamine--fructose-6-phosphate aminotransferase [isomerizing] n=2 Tax=Halomicrobium mukohataei TaxID=57705 RepID=C7NW27_HALMD|nr:MULTISPECIES: glutamine--fructose-6-phosphate transaminase (isomerizing) [Halomicrobium]ACV48156.1 glucosamine/fructose-6-phosphate aminotransferase, isomerizing [Halomicrobium mukohataei DSM 12286]QCD66580.1 glutamine--fructose-6-phosphate transaminase (isomerizing) [Halomicrobium mukohataei]QFR21386.1 glutamine--fructose-6-phosphate transaminase (isomerizing) [Halomicrobium sp. ZPS1]